MINRLFTDPGLTNFYYVILNRVCVYVCKITNPEQHERLVMLGCDHNSSVTPNWLNICIEVNVAVMGSSVNVLTPGSLLWDGEWSGSFHTSALFCFVSSASCGWVLVCVSSMLTSFSLRLDTSSIRSSFWVSREVLHISSWGKGTASRLHRVGRAAPHWEGRLGAQTP